MLKLVGDFVRGLQHELLILLILFLLFWLTLILGNVFTATPANARPTPLPSDADCTPPAVMMQLQCVTPAP